MTVTFYPRDIGMFRDGEYDFTVRTSNDLVCRSKYDYRVFHNRLELIEYLKTKRVRLDDIVNPLKFVEVKDHPFYGFCHAVIQWSLLGYIKETIC